ncbi:MAG TPA: RNA-directed DNA polymerase [Candidatus Saccharimonadales bacterium]
MAHKTLLELSADEARRCLLSNDNYINFDLPNYFDFSKLLIQVSVKLKDTNWEEYTSNVIDEDGEVKLDSKGNPIKKYPGYEFNVNHQIIVNKNSNLSWRPLEITHPVLYVALVHLLTEEDNWNIIISRFNELKCSDIEVASIPPGKSLNRKTNKAEQITKWWENGEQRSVELGLEYNYVSETDIADCYSSIYTHAISWAMHTREVAFKKQRDDSLLGNQIDKILMNMHHRQTNGIPQGSMLYDLLAELLLAYADTLICETIKEKGIEAYKIVRYRDDYKIFTKRADDGKSILRIISDQLVDLGLRPNANKTYAGRRLIDASFKADKLKGLFIPKIENNFAKRLMQIHQISEKHSNSGQVARMLNSFHDDMYSKLLVQRQSLQHYEKPLVMISILVDMCMHNPRFYNMISAIISLLLSQISEKKQVAAILHERLRKLPNSSLLDLSLQRAIYKYSPDLTYDEPLTKIVLEYNGRPHNIWNNDWLNGEMQELINTSNVIDQDILTDNAAVTSRDEVDEFRDIPS